MDDPLTMIPGVKNNKANLFAVHGIKMINDLIDLDDNAYYLVEANLYKAKYGDDKDVCGKEAWITKMKERSEFNKVACITDMVKFIIKETKQVYENTDQKDTYYWYHGALSQLTHDTCVQWMKATVISCESTSVYDRYIKPELGLNDKFGKRWQACPIGDSAELMPLDNLLNQETLESVRRHVIMSHSGYKYGEKDPRVFSLATLKEGASAYKRVWNPVNDVAPPSERIVQDINKAAVAMKTIHEAKGVFVRGLAGGRVPGQRHVNPSKKTSKNHGGKRVKLEYNLALDEATMHADLKSLLDDTIRDTTSFFTLRNALDP